MLNLKLENIDYRNVAVIIPCFNEGEAISQVVHGFKNALPEAPIYVYDNCSTDDTQEKARDAGAIVRVEYRKGKGNVVRRLFSDVDADFYILVDGDSTYDPVVAPKMLERLIEDKLDMLNIARIGVKGSYRKGHRLGNYLLTKTVRIIFGWGLNDMLSGYRIVSRRFVKTFPSKSNGFEIETEFTVDAPAIAELASREGVPIGGKDFKTGQTLLKTILAPGLKARMLGLSGWFSSNILGNRDGEVLDDPGSFKTKEESKLSVLEYILQPDLYPDLYGDFYNKVRINYYPPRGDNKEGWDNIDIFGWLGYPMQIKVDFLCRDSILAAPLVLDLALFFDLAQRAGFKGVQEWLSFYFKSPQAPKGLYPEHDVFIQLTKLKNTLRYLMGESQITHLGEYALERDKATVCSSESE